MIGNVTQNPPKRNKGSALAYLLVFVFALFIAILVVVYVITRRSNPVMLDEHGKPVPATSITWPEQNGGGRRA
jgi:hypothetical protein